MRLTQLHYKPLWQALLVWESWPEDKRFAYLVLWMCKVAVKGRWPLSQLQEVVATAYGRVEGSASTLGPTPEVR